jgi:hypothetical protein
MTAQSSETSLKYQRSRALAEKIFATLDVSVGVAIMVPVSTEANQTAPRAFEILLSRRGDVEKALAALVKRAARKGIDGLLTWTWGKAFEGTAEVPNVDGTKPISGARLSPCGNWWIIRVSRIPLALDGATPRLHGWRFAATLQHLDGENIVRTLPSEELPASYRTRGAMCDHCCSIRRRNDTYVLRHDDGRVTQVGSSCLRDFLGSDDAAEIAAKAEILALAASCAEDGEEGYGSGTASEALMSEYLPIVAWCVRENGWTSRTATRERERRPTANYSWTLMCSAKAYADAKCEPTADDIALAASAAEWSESLSDDAVNAGTSDYLHNLRAVLRTGVVSFRTAGIAASAVTAYQRHIGAERARLARPAPLDAYLGTVGDKVSFGLPAQVGKKGLPKKGAPVVLSAEPLTLDFVAGFETSFGYTTILKFRTVDGATVVWKASDSSVTRSDVGKRYALAGTIKAHDEYKGVKQTVLTRCSATEVAEVEQLAASGE